MLTYDQDRFLKDVCSHPFIPTTQRYARLGLTTNKGKKVKDSLIHDDWVAEQHVQVKARGKPSLMLKPTRKTREHYGLPAPKGRGSFEHRFWCHSISEWYSARGYQTRVEAFVNNKLVDVTARKGEERVAVEVTLSISNIEDNIRKDLEAGFHTVIIACKPGQLKRIERILDPCSRGVEIRSFSSFT